MARGDFLEVHNGFVVLRVKDDPLNELKGRGFAKHEGEGAQIFISFFADGQEDFITIYLKTFNGEILLEFNMGIQKKRGWRLTNGRVGKILSGSIDEKERFPIGQDHEL